MGEDKVPCLFIQIPKFVMLKSGIWKKKLSISAQRKLIGSFPADQNGCNIFMNQLFLWLWAAV
ncbi:MAG: hypothetical protein K2J67_03355, partial [Lachnospiraceae bacterium]|nr:hypothetical protein [Lachnospiraceae bacterium]